MRRVGLKMGRFSGESNKVTARAILVPSGDH
jgi:hypothetical protein